MQGYRIQIIKAKLESYWYAAKTGEVYWAVINQKDEYQDYKVIIEGIIPVEGLGTKYIDFDDVIVLKESIIRIDNSLNVKVVEL